MMIIYDDDFQAFKNALFALRTEPHSQIEIKEEKVP
jgi:hypothetical protein